MTSKSLLFVSFENFLEAKISGGVQVCTKEYIELFEACNFQVHIEPVPFTRNVLKRIKLKLGLDVYEGYDYKEIAARLISVIRKNKIEIVALNQVSLVGLAPFLKGAFGESIKILVLSHGNESGDFLHEVVLQKANPIKQWRLGAFLVKESEYFRNHVDAILCLSETEQHINNWLGAKRSFFIPRTYKPHFLPWAPVEGRVGFVGTLDHLPNYQGLVLYLDELQGLSTDGVCVRIVGGPEAIGRTLQQRYPCVEYLGRLDAKSLEAEASSWSLFLNPIFWFSRGASTKLAQGINWGLPILTTPAGNRGYTISNDQLATVYSANEMARKTIECLTNPEQLALLASEAQTIANSGPTYAQIMESVLSVLNASSKQQVEIA